MVSSAVIIKRKVFPTEAGNPPDSKATGDIEDGRSNFVTEKVVTDEPRAAPVPQATKEDYVAAAPELVKDTTVPETPREATEPVAKKDPKLVHETKPAKIEAKSVAPPPCGEVQNAHKDSSDTPLRKSTIVQL